MMSDGSPGELEVYGYFSAHLGPRSVAAGLRIQFLYNQSPGIHFKAQPPEEYRDSIVKGLLDGLAVRFPELSSASIWITEVTAHAVDSSQRAFYRAARMAIDQAFSLVESRNAEQSAVPPP